MVRLPRWSYEQEHLSSTARQEQSLSVYRWRYSICFSRDLSSIARILSFDTGLHLKDPVRLGDKVKLITVSALSFHMATAQEDFDAFCLN